MLEPKMEEEKTIALKNSYSEPCLVCDKLTTKLHLQVQICYSWAIFYRRSINAGKTYVCLNKSTNCGLKSATKRSMCRFCRFNKCSELNLNINKTKQSTPIFGLPYKTADGDDPWNVVDLFHNIHITLKQTPLLSSNDATSSATTFFTTAVTDLIKASQSTDKWQPADSVFIRANFANHFSLNTAKLLSNYPSFQKLPFDEKVIIHDRFWQLLMNLRNSYLTYIYFESGPHSKRIVDNYQYVDSSQRKNVNDVNFDLESTKLFIFPCIEKWNKFFDELKKLKPTLYEFNYICLIALWSFHSLPDLSHSTHKLGEEIIAEASSKLHEYYTTKLRMQNYAARQAKLFSMAQRVEEVVQAKREMLKAWHFFNFGPNAFSFCKFETNYYVYKNT